MRQLSCILASVIATLQIVAGMTSPCAASMPSDEAGACCCSAAMSEPAESSCCAPEQDAESTGACTCHLDIPMQPGKVADNATAPQRSDTGIHKLPLAAVVSYTVPDAEMIGGVYRIMADGPPGSQPPIYILACSLLN